MKIRQSFVSNSSSSSFCVLGCKYTEKLYNKALSIYMKENPDMTMDDIEDNGMHELFEGLGLRYYDETDYGRVVGVPLTSKTVDQIIELQKKLIELFGEGTYSVFNGTYYC